MIKTANCDLDLIYQAYRHVQDEKPEDYNCRKLTRFYYDEKGNSFTPYARFFGFIVALNNFNGFPKIVSDSDFRKIKSKQLYHGFRDADFATSLIFDFDYHLGVLKALGTFFSNKPWEAETYTWASKKNNNQDYVNQLNQKINAQNGSVDENIVLSDKNRILKAKVVSANHAHINQIREIRDNIMYFREFDKIENPRDRKKAVELYNYCFKYDALETYKAFNENPRQDFFEAIANDEKLLALYLGYDYITIDPIGKQDCEHTLVFNRNAIVVPESEVERFKSMSTVHANSSYLLTSLDEVVAGGEESGRT